MGAGRHKACRPQSRVETTAGSATLLAFAMKPYPRSSFVRPCIHQGRLLLKGHLRSPSQAGFTRMELLATAMALILLALVALPLLASTSTRSDRVACLNNLRVIGRAFQSWGQDHGDRTPWNTTYCEGGTKVLPQNSCNEPPPAILTSGLQNNLWFQLMWVSNELSSPKYLADPSDARVRAAQDWGTDPNTGFLHANFRNLATSYFIGLHATAEFHDSALSGDRNVQTTLSSACALGIQPVATITSQPTVPARLWQNGPHGWSGNVLRFDGVVEQADDSALGRRIFPAGSVDDNGSQHFMLPQ